jgi:hypothetical protein
MHEFPFGARITDKLFSLARQPPDPASYGTLFIPCIASAQFLEPGRSGWWLAWIPAGGIQPERLFPVDGIVFFIPKNVEPLLCGQVFDWDESTGIVALQN